MSMAVGDHPPGRNGIEDLAAGLIEKIAAIG
jgi:hypothetical protein